MPRPKKETDKEPKKRSRTGCWPCKARKVKCGEEKPACLNCSKSGEHCDYSIRLNWGGRTRRDADSANSSAHMGQQTTFLAGNSLNSAGSGEGEAAHHLFAAPQTSPSHSFVEHKVVNNAAQAQNSQPNLKSLDPALLVTDRGPTGSVQVASMQPAWRHSPLSPDVSLASTDNPHESSMLSPHHRHKRLKSDSTIKAVHDIFANDSDTSLDSGHVPRFATFTSSPNDNFVFGGHTPTTPESMIFKPSPNSLKQYAPDLSDLRRLSVRSLLSDPTDDSSRSGSGSGPSKSASLGFRTYGYDHGFNDFDVPQNDDFAVLLSRSPDRRRASAAASDVSTSSGEPDLRPVAFEPGGYYAEPVPIKLSKALEPLPAELRDNPMNLLYFHHFINHTGRILVAHDCPENPFRAILPQMAVRNTQLLHLLLSFSASHRARLLGHSEPVKRIAQWMEDVLPALRNALDETSPMSPTSSDLTDPTSLAPLATAIMLASLEIVSPSVSSFSIPWHSHLSVARRLIRATGGLDNLAQRADGVRDRAIFFLSRWFAYLDVLGALSDWQLSAPLYDAYLEDGGGRWLVNRHNEEVFQIDCIFGFSGRCIALLAQVAELVHRCDVDRIDPVTKLVNTDWAPSDAVRQQATELERRLIASANTVYRGCNHHVNTPGSIPGDESTPRQTDEDLAEIYATNEAFHWAGLIQLMRRVFALPSSDPRVQELVARTTQALGHVRRGSTAESCLLYPTFSAGVEARDDATRAFYADRLQNSEHFGIGNFEKARKVMQAAWKTGLPWELLTEGEFLG